MDFRSVISEEFRSRRLRNPQYSLRAYARDLEIDAAQLSCIISGKQGLSRDRATRIASELKLSQSETIEFLDNVDANHARSKAARSAAQIKLSNRGKVVPKDLSVDQFRVVADWFHFAILELCELKGGKANARVVSAELGIELETAKAAIERLLRLDLLEKKNGLLLPTESETHAPIGVSERTKRMYHRALGAKALDALEEQAFDQRYFSSDVFAIDSQNLDELRQLIVAFRRSLAELAHRAKNKDSVYCLNIQAFDLTHKGEKG